MRNRFRRAAVVVLALLVLGVSPAAAAPQQAALADPVGGTAADLQPPALREVGIDQRLNEHVPLDLVFRDESGRAVALGDYLERRPVILSLVYYECPMLCTLVLNGLVRALRVLSFNVGAEFEVVTVSFDPHDTPELATKKKERYLAEYGRAGATAGWHFLTGEGPEIERLAQSVGFRFKYLPDDKQFAHAAAIMVLTPEGKIARYFYGVDYSPRDLRLGLVEAARGEIGSPVDTLLLYCFRYDPHSGKYSVLTLNLVRLGGLLTVCALATFVVVMHRRERASVTESGGVGEVSGPGESAAATGRGKLAVGLVSVEPAGEPPTPGHSTSAPVPGRST